MCVPKRVTTYKAYSPCGYPFGSDSSLPNLKKRVESWLRSYSAVYRAQIGLGVHIIEGRPYGYHSKSVPSEYIYTKIVEERIDDLPK